AALETAPTEARLVRGRSAVAVLGSECCYWRTDEVSASSDEEVVAAAEPSMAMCPDGGLLLLGSSVYRRRGHRRRGDQSQAFGRVTFTLFGFAHWLAPPLECRSNPWRKLQFPGWAEIIRKWSVEKRRIPYRAALFKDCEAGAVMAVLANGGVRVVGAAARWWAPYRLRALVAPRWLRM